MAKAKRFQPLAVLNQKLKGLEVFEPNEPPRSPAPQANSSTSQQPQPDPDEVITREHWQRYRAQDKCSEPICGKRLTSANGIVNCRKCGRLFCDEHTMYQIKLSRSAQHEPVRGLWCRVCETCYKSREGYNDRNGWQYQRDKQAFGHNAEISQVLRETLPQTSTNTGRKQSIKHY